MTDSEFERRKEVAKSVSILDIAAMTGYTLVKRGNYWSFKEHDSVVIDTKKNIFYHNSQHLCGDPIKMLQHFNNLSYKDAVNTILDSVGYSKDNFNKKQLKKRRFDNVDDVKKSFVLPDVATDVNGAIYTDKVEDFLINTRKLSPNVVKDFIDNGRLYQQSIRQRNFKKGLFRSCCCFVGYPTGKNDCSPNFCERRTITPVQGKKKTLTVPASDWKHGFYINNNKKTMVLTEGILDSMAIMTLLEQQGLDYKKYDYLALIGTNKTNCLVTILKEQPHIKNIIISLDNDEGGEKSIEATIELLKSNFPHIRYVINIPQEYKDYNDVLMGKKR